MRGVAVGSVEQDVEPGDEHGEHDPHHTVEVDALREADILDKVRDYVEPEDRGYRIENAGEQHVAEAVTAGTCVGVGLEARQHETDQQHGPHHDDDVEAEVAKPVRDTGCPTSTVLGIKCTSCVPYVSCFAVRAREDVRGGDTV